MASIADGTYFIINGASINTSVTATKNVYRSYNPNTGDHFFTTSYSEHWKATHSGYSNEGVAFQVFDVGSTPDLNTYSPVYRLYKSGSGHLYTTNATERANLLKKGWKNEGIAWYGLKSTPAGKGGAAVHRLYCPSSSSSKCRGKHHYTVSVSEVNDCKAQKWTDEGVQFYAGGIYALDLSTSRMTDYGASTQSYSNGTNVQIYTSSHSDAQIWQVKTNSDGSRKILNPATGRMMSVAGDSTFTQGDNVHLRANSTKYPANQKWQFVDNNSTQTYQGKKYAEFRIKLFGNPGGKEWDLDVLGVDSGQTARLEPGRNVDIAQYVSGRQDRLWIFVPVPEFRPDATAYTIRPLLDTSKYLNPTGNANGSQVTIAKSSGTAKQYWTILELDNSTDTGKYVIYNVMYPTKVVDVKGTIANVANGSKIQMSSFDNRTNSWNVTRYEDTVINGKAYATVKFGFSTGTGASKKNWALDLKGANVSDGQNVMLYEDNNGDNQRWVLIPQKVASSVIPMPTDLGLAIKLGEKTTASKRGMANNYRPYWKGPNGWLGSLNNCYEWRYRSRYMSSASSTWLSWSDWSDWTNSELYESSGYFWVEQGLPTSYSQMNYKNLQINFQVRCTTMDPVTKVIMHGPSADKTVSVVFVPKYTFTGSFMTPDGLQINYSHDYTRGQANMRLVGIDILYPDHTVSNILTNQLDVMALNPTGSILVPSEALSAYPDLTPGTKLRLTYYRGNDQQILWTGTTIKSSCPYTPTAGTLSLDLATFPYRRHTALLRVRRTDNVSAWLSRNNDMYVLPEITDLGSGIALTETFVVPDGTTTSTFKVSRPPLATLSVSTQSLGEIAYTSSGKTYDISPTVLGRAPYDAAGNVLTVKYETLHVETFSVPSGTPVSEFTVDYEPYRTVSIVSTSLGTIDTYTVVDSVYDISPLEVSDDTVTITYTEAHEETFAVSEGTTQTQFTISTTPYDTISLSTPILGEITQYELSGSTYNISPYVVGDERAPYVAAENTITIVYTTDAHLENYRYFLIPYTWSQDSRLGAYGYSNDYSSWGYAGTTLSANAVDNTPVHSWIGRDGSITCIDCRPDVTLSSTADYSADTTVVKLAGRTRDFVSVGTVISNQFTIEGAVMYSDEYGHTDCNLEELQGIVGTHCLYRNPHGNLLRVVVSGVSTEAFYYYATVRVTMIEESR